MEFRDLKKQYAALKNDIDRQIDEVITSSRFIGGSKVSELEEKLAAYVGVKHCVTCGNGTDALELALMAWGIGEGDAVFVPDFTFFSSGEVVAILGATPVFVDVDEDTFNMDAASLEKAITGVVADGKLRPRVVVPVDLFGLPANFPEIRKVADKYGLKILEDGAQGFGGEINGQKACSFGDISTTSFFPAKPLGCYGDGGAIFTNDDEAAELIRSYCVHGKGKMKYDNVRIGMNSRLDSIQAGILLPKLAVFAEYEVADVNSAAAKYTELLNGTVATPVVPEGFLSSWAQYTIKLENREQRDALQTFLKEKSIPSMIYYPKQMHNQEAFSGENDYGVDCSVTNRLCDTVLSLPIHPYISDDDVNEVASVIKEFLGQ
ncbi:DegT/DnrJ/EryC1/StrS family aminotransferase [Mogibacterium neglectum]|uniref:DegT/DnrJ/EryC1/StrS family aminotransferase n=1 Tax=Mogibacterium neglectum TaxID=114528 RepID=UPI00272C2F37|nr:DegT/DnrJ/EryC1/StrS family aminotransferase [Mogibacterium neglectum]WLD76354.1 DegT/DnrJ/EryC1/StrS family aminotransferase [Mogibacterium neglectum]